MPQTMCWNPICTVAEVWHWSEHYLWLFGEGLYFDPFTVVYVFHRNPRKMEENNNLSTCASSTEHKDFFLSQSCLRIK